MSCERATILATQQAPLSVRLVFRNPDNDDGTPGDPIDLSAVLGAGGHAIFRAKDSLTDTAYLIEEDITSAQNAPDLTLGIVHLTLTAGALTLDAPNRALWQVEFSLGDPASPFRYPRVPGVLDIQAAVVV